MPVARTAVCYIWRTMLVLILTQATLTASTEPTGAAKRPLRFHPDNPRYFTDGSGKGVLLTGSHTWANLQDYAYDKLPSPAPMDFGDYLAFLKRYNPENEAS
jgi:hypothetical protein